MKIKAFIYVLVTAMLLCGVLPLTGGAYAAADGADKSYAAAAEAMVLLKNDSGALPLTPTDKIAIFGAGQVYTDGKTGGFYLMGRGSGYFVPSETPKSPCDVLASYVDAGKLGGVYTPLSDAYKAAAVSGADFSYAPTDEEYTAAAEYADKAVYMISRSASEGSDIRKAYFALTSDERIELQKVCAAFDGKPVIVILDVGYTMDTGFASGRVGGIYANALLTANYLGIRGIDALCKALIGEINPSGKTANTYAKQLTDYPSYDSFYASNNYTTYSEDIYLGYRYFETFDPSGEKIDYPFGYGLSYTTFDISAVTCTETGGKITVTATVTNTGSTAGKEVVQVYFGAPQKGTSGARLSKAAKELCGFQKTSLLAPGASETVRVSFDIDDMASYDDLGVTGHKSAYVMEAGDYTVYVGNSVRNTTVAGTHTENQLRVVKQLSELCEPTTAFARLTFDGAETVGENSAFRSDLLHTPTATVQSAPTAPIQFIETLDGTAAVSEFLAQMSNEELGTIALMTNASPTNTGAWGGSPEVVEKYGIPLAYTCDGPAGIRHTTKGTGLPSATALASTWNPELVAALGDVVGRECVATDIDVWLAPGVNLHRFPLCGRNFEYYSEDPYLTGVMAAELIQGVQAHGVPCAIKHFIANERETNRLQNDSRMSERALRELYLVPFKLGVNAGVGVVMTSYNLLNGTETAENAELIRGILRGEWGFDGLVTTDWSNDSHLANELIAGNNVHSSMHWGADGSAYEYHMDDQYAALLAAVKDGTVSRSLLIENATYVMDILKDTYAAARLHIRHDIAAVGASTFAAEDYTQKHGYARPETSGSRTLMSYVRGTNTHTPYLLYTLNVEKAGTYILTTSYANASADTNADALRVFVNDNEQLTNYNAPSTGGWSKLANAEICKLDLNAGKIELKIKSAENTACGNFDAFTLTPIDEVYTAVSSAEDLLSLMGDSTKWSGKYYLTKDIDLAGAENQSPIGTNAQNFTGVFDGMGHAIRGLSLSTAAEVDFGLFGKVKGGVIRDLTVYGEVTSTTAANAVVGGIVGTLDPGAFIVGCQNYAAVTYENAGKAAKGVGGVVGYVYAGSVNTGTVVKNCKNYGAVASLSGGKDAAVGGIAGTVGTNAAAGTTSPGSVRLIYCENYGDVRAEGVKAGGIVGYIDQLAPGGKVEVAYSANHGAVTSEKGRMGGIAGFVYGRTTTAGRVPCIRFCLNDGALTANVGYESAGVVGYNVGANMDNCVNLGVLTANDSDADEKPMGGVVGKTFTSTALTYGITNCYTTSGEVIPEAGYEKPAQFVLTDCAIATEADLKSKNTTLTYGTDGYVVTEDGLTLTVFAAPAVQTGVGDIDGNGKITVRDALLAIRALLNCDMTAGLQLLDTNGDGMFSIADILHIIKQIAE
ncbi:MAG: glycoside hydrolase family 3 C-terminal domain-containing protein [Clostridia bacterium]|nr:glycoside hydrolase family 3 C-terminal domain-containing protein [Clostridia bacterium]